MGILEVACGCGQRISVPESAYGTSQPCPRCGGNIYVSLSSLRASVSPAEAPQRAPAASPAAAPPAVELRAETCTRCGRAFRGDWDRQPGGLCNICANQAAPVHDRPEPAREASSPAAAPPTRRMLMPEYHQVSPYIIEEAKPKAKRDMKKMKREAIVLGVAFLITMALIVILPTDQIVNRDQWEAKGEVSRAWAGVVIAVKIVSIFAGSFIAFYIVLHRADKLPRETFLGNTIAVGPVVVGLAIMAALPFPAPIGCTMLTLYVCFFVYDLSFGQFMELLLFGVLANLLVAALTPLIFFLIALVAV